MTTSKQESWYLNQARMNSRTRRLERDAVIKDLAHKVGFGIDIAYDESNTDQHDQLNGGADCFYSIHDDSMKESFICSTPAEALAFLAGVMWERVRVEESQEESESCA